MIKVNLQVVQGGVDYVVYSPATGHPLGTYQAPPTDEEIRSLVANHEGTDKTSEEIVRTHAGIPTTRW